MENRSLLKKYGIPISHLDFGYVDKCTNIKELERIVTILRSGEEGFYPDLTKCAEEKLRKLKPDSRVLRKEEKVLTKNSFSKEEWQEHSAPLIEWSTEIKNKEAILSTIQEGSSVSIDDFLPPIRRSGRVNATRENTADVNSKPSTREGAARPAATNYRQWDKYDADAEMLKMDLDEERVKEHVERMNKINKEISGNPVDIEEKKPDVYSKLTPIEREKLFEDYKIRGNECFKSKEYTEALQHYTRCIQILPSPIAYNNRAITNIKLQRYTDAVSDCQECLQRDPSNVKGLLRKAVALLELGKKIDAYQTYEEVTAIDPGNATACKALESLRTELGEVAPSHATRIKIVESEEVGGKPKSVINQQQKPPPPQSVVNQQPKPPPPQSVVNQQPKPPPPPTVDYDLAELVKPNKVVKSKLTKAMENLGKVTKNKAKPSGERTPQLKSSESNPEIKLFAGDAPVVGSKGKMLIQEL